MKKKRTRDPQNFICFLQFLFLTFDFKNVNRTEFYEIQKKRNEKKT